MSTDLADTKTLHDKFLEAMDRNALELVAAVVACAHVTAPATGEARWGRVGLKRSGLLRWIQIDADLLKLNGLMRNVKIELVPNSYGGGDHIEIAFGEFKLMLAHDADPDSLVPFSEYGKTKVQSNSGYLFAQMNEDESSECAAADFYYAYLFHAKSQMKGEPPECLEIRFPDGNGEYGAAHLKMYELFPRLRDKAWLLLESARWSETKEDVKVETIKEEALPKLRKVAQSGT